jgi:hypothetical protein
MARLVLEQRMVPGSGGDPTRRREVFTLIEPFRVGHRLTGVITVPAGRCCFVSDLASVPWFLVWLVGRTGHHLRAAIVHDWLIDRLGQAGAPVAERCNADEVFLDLMAADGVPLARRRLIHAAVTLATEMTSGPTRRLRALVTVATPALWVLLAPLPIAPAMPTLAVAAMTLVSWWHRLGVAALIMVTVAVLTHVTLAVMAVRTVLVGTEMLIDRVACRRRWAPSPAGRSDGHSPAVVPGSTSSLVAVVANSTDDGGTKPSTAWKVKCCDPGRSGSSATSTTMISPVENSL